MKKSTLKEQLQLASLKEETLIHMLRGASSEIEDLKEALRRRRILYDRLANHATIEQPKSMMEMAASLYMVHTSMSETLAIDFKDLPQDIQDRWMDRLLTILN